MHAARPDEPESGLTAKIRRRFVQWRKAAPVTIQLPSPVLTLTFDDCPQSATRTGAQLLDQFGVCGCFYVATSQLGTDTVVGRIAGESDLKAVHRTGHEIGAHTHSHMNCAVAPMADILADLERNLEALDPITGGEDVVSFAFPFGETSFSTKHALSKQFTTLRGIKSGAHRGPCDRAHLFAFELDGSAARLTNLLEAMEAAMQTPAWIIMFTHDVSEQHGPFGIPPAQLSTVLERARSLGIAIKTPRDMARELDLGTGISTLKTASQ